jgi:hypothetical protein
MRVFVGDEFACVMSVSALLCNSGKNREILVGFNRLTRAQLSLTERH